MAQDEEGLLKRWSRRKLEQRDREHQADSPAPGEESGSTAVTSAGETPSADTTPAAADAAPDLPPIESLTRDSDFTIFMRDGVPDDLRNQALRKLWRSDPVFANLDGMLEYGEDYSQLFKSGVGATLKTLYRVGQGYLAEPIDAAPESPVEVSDPAVAAAAAPSAEEALPDPKGANRDDQSAPEAGAEASDSTDAESSDTAEFDKV
ncbi:MAG: DUF3306 domain-containing protein [Dongiaceae bacterium]